MTAIDIDQESESDGSSVSHDKSCESDGKYEKYGESKEGYEAYKTKSSHEYTPYKEADQAVELVYDRYDSDYEEEQPGQEPKPKESCCKKGRLYFSRDGLYGISYTFYMLFGAFHNTPVLYF